MFRFTLPVERNLHIAYKFITGAAPVFCFVGARASWAQPRDNGSLEEWIRRCALVIKNISSSNQQVVFVLVVLF